MPKQSQSRTPITRPGHTDTVGSVCNRYLEEVGHLVDAVEHHIGAYHAGIYASRESREAVLETVERLLARVRRAERENKED